jgi:hypothetical protein
MYRRASEQPILQASHKPRQPTGEFSNQDAIGREADIRQQGHDSDTFGAKRVTIGYNALGQRTSLDRHECLATTNWGCDTAPRQSSSFLPERNMQH